MDIKTKLKEKLSELKEKISSNEAGKFFREKGGVILGSFLLIIVITVSVALVSAEDTDTLGNESTPKYLGQSVLVDVNANKEPLDEETDYFQNAVLDRKQVREEALAVLEQVAANPDVLPDTKDQALSDIAAIVKEMSVESTIESLIKAKGIDDCMAVLSEGKCTVIVKTDGLLANEVAQILEIVVLEASLSPENITISEMK